MCPEGLWAYLKDNLGHLWGVSFSQSPSFNLSDYPQKTVSIFRLEVQMPKFQEIKEGRKLEGSIFSSKIYFNPFVFSLILQLLKPRELFLLSLDTEFWVLHHGGRLTVNSYEELVSNYLINRHLNNPPIFWSPPSWLLLDGLDAMDFWAFRVLFNKNWVISWFYH